MKYTDLADLSATELLALYRAKAASPVEATQSVLARIEKLNPKLNAFCLLDHTHALQAAKESEQRWWRGEPMGVLDGVPASVKDLILTKGWPTRRGSRTINPNQPWEIDAPAVARLREAGAILLGKTCSAEYGCKLETNSPLTGITRNPWNLNKTPGGSSGGTAAAVAAGMGPISVGTDGAGSVRIPAAFCGNFGLKPSFGRVPAYPFSPFGSISHLGPHTMSVSDAALVMNVLKTPDSRDWSSLPPDSSDYRIGLNDGIQGIRVAYSPTLGFAKNVDPDVASAVHRSVSQLEELGARIEQVDPGIEDPLDIIAGLWFSGVWSVWKSLSPAQQEVTDPDFQAQALRGKDISLADIHELNRRRTLLGSHMRQFMESYDLLVTPTVAIPAFDARDAGHSPTDPQAMLGWTPFSYAFNLTQQPAATIPCGVTSDGLPIGVQLVGPMFSDAMVLRAARAYETVKPIARPPMNL